MRLFFLFLAGCTGAADDPEEPVFVPSIPTSDCGGPSYEWAPMDRMGEVVYWEPMLEASIQPVGIEALQQSAGMELVEDVPYGTKAYRYRYVTQDRGEVVEATGMVAFPDTQGAPLKTQTVLWLHPTVGFSDECAPSANGLEHAVPMLVGASQGYIVVAPDYLGMTGVGEPSGMLHPYVVAEPTAIASLDAYRGMVELATGTSGPQLGVEPNGDVVIWGISEGGFASLWTDRYQPHYLPDVNVQGVAAIIPASDIRALAQHGLSTFGDTTWGILAMFTTAHAWFGRPGALSDALTDEEPAYLASRLEDLLASDCSPTGFEGADSLNGIEDLYTESFVEAVQSGDWEAAEPFSCYLDAATLQGSSIPRERNSPVLFVVAEEDELAYAGTEREGARTLCEEGQSIEYIECDGADHVDGAVETLRYQWQWIARRLEGEPWLDGGSCQIGAPMDCETLMD